MYQPYNDRSAIHQATAKYILPYVIGFFVLMLVGQLIGQLFTVKQLNKVSGKIVDLQTKLTYVSTARTGNRRSYALFVTLNNGSVRSIQDEAAQEKLDTLLHVGNDVTIYYPTLLYKILSTGFVHDVNQLELGNQVVYNFDEQKKENWVLVGFSTVAAVVFYALRRSMLKGDW
jgi:hypothetical protein